MVMKGINNKMLQGIKQTIIGLLLVPLVAMGIATVVQVGTTEIARAAETKEEGAVTPNSNITSGMNAAKGSSTVPTDVNNVFKTVTDILFFLIGAVSVIMLIYGGIRYTTSGGNANSVTAAKNTIIYSIVGLVVAILAYSIVSFVVNSLV